MGSIETNGEAPRPDSEAPRSHGRRRRTHKLPLRKLLPFALFTVVLFWAATEALLALFHFRPIVETEDPYVGFVAKLPLFVEERRADGVPVMRTAPNKRGYFNLQEFPLEKSGNTFRIFCLGGSTTYGHPYTDPTSYCGWLRELLPEIDPGRTWEVVNAGGVSYASYREAALMQELARYEPDLFVVYTGHNEFLERRTYSGILQTNPGVTWLGAVFGRTRTYAALRTAVRAVRPDPAVEARKRYQMTGEVDALLDAMVGLSAYTRADTLQQQVIEHYRFNLHRMVRIARSAGARIVFVTVASNLKDTAPFKSQHTAGLTESEAERSELQVTEARRARESGDLGRALEAAREAATLDPRCADAQYELGRSLFAAKQYEPAHEAFRRARDEDVCPLRQLTVMRDIKLAVGAREGVPVVDYVQIIEDSMLQRYGHRIAGEEFFLDHAHPTIAGNRILAVALIDELIRDGAVHPAADWRERVLPRVTERIESRVDRKTQAVALRNLARLFSWAGKGEEAERLANQSLELDPNELESLVVLGSRAAADGDADRAMEYYERVLAIDPNHMEARNNLAVELARRGEHELALQHYEAMLKVDPNQPNVHFNAGLACMRTEDWDAAITHFERVLELRPEDASALPSLATALARAGRGEEAVSRYEAALAAAPTDAEIHLHFATLLGQLRRQAEATDHLREAARLAPENAEVRLALGILLLKQEAFDEAKRHLAAAIRLDPELPGGHNAMGTVLWREGKLDEAIAEYDAELRLDPDHVEARNNQAFILVSQGRAREAIAAYREILRRSPEDAMTLNGLAWILATHPDPDVRDGREAVDLAGRAVELTGGHHPLALLTLAAAYAEVGRFEDATATARRSIAAARDLDQAALERRLESLLAVFESGQPYRDAPNTR